MTKKFTARKVKYLYEQDDILLKIALNKVANFDLLDELFQNIEGGSMTETMWYFNYRDLESPWDTGDMADKQAKAAAEGHWDKACRLFYKDHTISEGFYYQLVENRRRLIYYHNLIVSPLQTQPSKQFMVKFFHYFLKNYFGGIGAAGSMVVTWIGDEVMREHELYNFIWE